MPVIRARLSLAAAILASVTAATALPARAEEAGNCPRNARYVVVPEAHSGDPGERFAVYRIGKTREFTPCRFDAARATMVIGETGDPLWFSALQDNVLVLTRSTGPDGDLVVYDLDNGKVVLDVPANQFETGTETITFWQREGTADAATCPDFDAHQKNGFGSALTAEKTLDLKTFAVSPTGRTGCEPTQ